MNISKALRHECSAVLFDFGGTLDSDGEHWLDRFYALYSQADLEVPPHEIKRAFYHADEVCCQDGRVISMGLRETMSYHVGLQFDLLNLRDKRKEQELVDAFCVKSERFLRRNVSLLKSMKDHYRLGVVSNFYGNVATISREAGLASFLDVILDSTLLGCSKPDPEIFRIALARLALSPERVIFVGDSYERDVIPAKNLGMKTIWLKGPNPRIPQNGPPADAWISSLTELEALNT